MNWGELAMEIDRKDEKEDGRSFVDSTVMVYDAEKGEYYPAELVVFEESDGIIDAGTMFISINSEIEDE
jgi:hypothetical protein